MATKAQQFRSNQQVKAHSSKAHKRSHKKRPSFRAALAEEGFIVTRNWRRRAEARGGASLEEPSNGKPSRKSTRKSSDHTKRTTNQQLRKVRAVRSPQARARKAVARGQA